jgi:hypothetical protein
MENVHFSRMRGKGITFDAGFLSDLHCRAADRVVTDFGNPL